MLSELQRVLVEALRRPHPEGYLRAVCDDDAVPLTADERRWLLGAHGENVCRAHVRNVRGAHGKNVCGAHGDGLRMSRVLVRKLRLQRLLRGDPGAARELQRDEVAFAARFAAYDRDVPPTALFPADEARLYRDYLARASDEP